MIRRQLLFCSLAVASWCVSCGKSDEPAKTTPRASMPPPGITKDEVTKELPYNELGYHDGIFTEPGGTKPFTGTARDHYKDGKLKAEYPCRNGKFHGTVKEWHANGQRLAETEFKDGERTGINREWKDTGEPYMERVYDHDRIVSEKKY